MVDWKHYLMTGLILWSAMLPAQDLPNDELQINFSTYFDNFQVTVIYPNISVTHKVTEYTAFTARYLVDLVSAASIKNPNSKKKDGGKEDDDDKNVDVVTTASGRGGISLKLTDDVRNQFGLGITQMVFGRTITVNGLFSREHDYSSGTIAGTISQKFAKKNTTFQIGFVRSWDKVFPTTKDWKRDVKVSTISASFNQILSKRLISQLNFSYTDNNGQLADVYKTINIGESNTITKVDPIHPETRLRRAVANRFVYRLNSDASLLLGYRYYWDSWDIRSHTISSLYQKHLSTFTSLGIGLRTYFQNRAFFFKEKYFSLEQYMTADNKLDNVRSTELELKLTVNGGYGRTFLPFLEDERIQYNFSFNWYQRHTNSPDWFSGRKNLTAIYLNIGLRYRF